MTAPSLRAGDLTVEQIGPYVLEVRGGAGANAWHIQYGTVFKPSKFVVLPGPGPITYFSHYNWLRQIDTEKGVVTGRWMYPGNIERLSLKEGKVDIQVNLNSLYMEPRIRNFELDPNAPRQLDIGYLGADIPEMEATRNIDLRSKLPPDRLSRVLAELENTVRRDPVSPFLRIRLGQYYRERDDPRSSDLIKEGIQLQSAHYSELLAIALTLDAVQLRDLADETFDRAYAKFWQAGQDPRLVNTFSGVNSRSPNRFTRAYALAPWVQGAAGYWKSYGDYLLKNGKKEEGATWFARADDAQANSLFLDRNSRYRTSLRASLVSVTALAASILFAAVLFFRYLPQRAVRRKAEREAGVSRPGFLHTEYWSRTERFSFLLLVAVAWLARGYSDSGLRAISNRALYGFYDSRTGILLSSSAIERLQANPPSPERDLVLAMAYQLDEQPNKAEPLYRGVPQFANAWNNLGVLLKNAGKDDEAHRAFERALQIRPDFPEAEWNLGKPPRGEWVTQHAKYLPEKPMFAVPTRSEYRRAYWPEGERSDWPNSIRGPLIQADTSGFNFYFEERSRLQPAALIFCGAGALILVFMRPREVVQPPHRMQVIFELLFPGTARVWSALAPLVLVFAGYCSAALWPVRWKELYISFSFGGPGQSLIPPPGARMEFGPEQTNPIPPLSWLITVFAVNAAVVLFWKWRQKSPIIPKAAAPSSSG
jgi:tetratricopeptide (TPR) repeat protein